MSKKAKKPTSAGPKEKFCPLSNGRVCSRFNILQTPCDPDSCFIQQELREERIRQTTKLNNEVT